MIQFIDYWLMDFDWVQLNLINQQIIIDKIMPNKYVFASFQLIWLVFSVLDKFTLNRLHFIKTTNRHKLINIIKQIYYKLLIHLIPLYYPCHHYGQNYSYDNLCCQAALTESLRWAKSIKQITWLEKYKLKVTQKSSKHFHPARICRARSKWLP